MDHHHYSCPHKPTYPGRRELRGSGPVCQSVGIGQDGPSAGSQGEKASTHAVAIRTNTSSNVQITVLGPFHHSEPATTARSSKHDGSSSDEKPAGGPADSFITSTAGSPRAASPNAASGVTKNAGCASVPQPHHGRTGKPEARDKHRGARSPPRKICGFCRSFSGPDAVCVHPGQPHKVIRKGDRLLVRVRNPTGTCRWEKKPRPVKAGYKTREKL